MYSNAYSPNFGQDVISTPRDDMQALPDVEKVDIESEENHGEGTPGEAFQGFIEGCCRMRPLAMGCCVGTHESTVEYLGQDGLVAGYEFPVLRKMKNDGSDNMDPTVLNAAMKNMLQHQEAHEKGHPAKIGGVGLDPVDIDVDNRSKQTAQSKRTPDPRQVGGNCNPIPDMATFHTAENQYGAELPDEATENQAGPASSGKSNDPSRTSPKVKKGRVFLDDVHVLKDAFWCTYCCCAGFGCGQLAYCRLLTKCCCYSFHCEEKAPGHGDEHDVEGCYQSICSCLCCHFLCQLPCRPGMSRCICCNEPMHSCGQYKRAEADNSHGHIDHGDHEGAQPMFNYLIYDAFTPMYCCCMGCSCKAEMISICKNASSCCCCRTLCEESMPDFGNDGLCTCLLTCLTCYSQCQCLPKKEHNPCVACCGMRMKKMKDPHKIDSAPSQQSMH